MRPKVFALLLPALILAAVLVTASAARADAALSYEQFAALIETNTAKLANGRQASEADVAAWRDIIFHPTDATTRFAQRFMLDPQRSTDERIVAAFAAAMLNGEARVGFATPIVAAIADGRSPGSATGFQGYSLLEAALFAPGDAPLSFGTPAGRALLAKARGIDGLDPRLAWTIDSARGAPHPPQDDASFGRLLEAIARIALQSEDHDLTRVVAFRDIARDPMPYRELALRAVRDNALSVDARIVAVLAMQRLPDDAYFAFLDAVAQETLDGTIPKTPGTILKFEKSILAAALFPQPPYAYPSARMFGRDPRAVALIAKAKRAGDPSARETDIAERSQALLAGGPSYATYVESLKPIAARLVNLDWYDGVVFGNTDFLAIFEYPEPYRALADQAMHDAALDLDVRIVAALTIQRLPEDALLDVLERLVADAAAGRLDTRRGKVEPDSILEAALFPNRNFNAYLRLAPDAPRVRPLLLAAQRLDGLSDWFRRQIADALSGKTRSEDLETYGGADPIPRLDYVRDGKDASIAYGPMR